MGNPEAKKNNLDAFERKGVNDLFDFSGSSDKSRMIEKEKKGFDVIKTELQRLYTPGKKFTADDINQAFFSYSGKEMNKVAKGPMKDKLETKRREVLFDLQTTEPRDDPRKRLQAIAGLSDEIVEVTGAASGASKKGNDEKNQPDTQEELKTNDLLRRVAEFKKLIIESQITEQKERAEKSGNIVSRAGIERQNDQILATFNLGRKTVPEAPWPPV